MQRQQHSAEHTSVDKLWAARQKQRCEEAVADSEAPSPAPSETGDVMSSTQAREDGDQDQTDETAPDPQSAAMQLSLIAPFVSKTYRIVNDEPDDIVSWWTSDGEDTFVVKRVNAFQEQVLPRFFSHRKYSSFVRQLNNHGFSRVRSPSSAGGTVSDARGGRPEQEAQWWEFKHPKFRRGYKGLLSEIKRRKEKKKSTASAAAQPRLFGSAPMPGASGNHAQHHQGGVGHYTVRWEMEHIREQMQDMSRKLDDLKQMVVRLVVCIRDSGIPMSVSPPTRASTSAAGVSVGVYASDPSMLQSPQRKLQQIPLGPPVSVLQQQQVPLPMKQPAPSMQQLPPTEPPTAVGLQPPLMSHQGSDVVLQHQQGQSREQQSQHQQQAPGQQHVRGHLGPDRIDQQHSQPVHQQRQSPRRSLVDEAVNGWPMVAESSTSASDSTTYTQQVNEDGSIQPGEESGRREGAWAEPDSEISAISNGATKKRAREGTATFQETRPREAPASTTAFPSVVGMPQAVGGRVEGAPETPEGQGVALIAVPPAPATGPPGGATYPEAWMGFQPQGGDGSSQPVGGSMSSWQTRWHEGATENFYPYHVPIRPGYPFAMPLGIPMRYAVSNPAGAPFLPVRRGAPPAAVGSSSFASASAVLPPREVLQGQVPSDMPLERVEGSIAMTLSTLKGGSNA